jgi:PAS domain S-box-containing protein
VLSKLILIRKQNSEYHLVIIDFSPEIFYIINIKIDMSYNILVVEDDQIIAQNIEMLLEKLGYNVLGLASSCEETVRIVEKHVPDLILMDINIEGDIDGIETASIIRSSFDVPVVYLTAFSDKKTLERAELTEPFGYIVKPFNERDFKITVQMALNKSVIESKFKKRAELYYDTLKSAGDFIICTDMDYKISYMSQLAENFLQVQFKDVRGLHINEVMKLTDSITGKEVLNPAIQAINAGKTVHLSEIFLLELKDGRRVPIEDSCAVIKNKTGGITGTVMIFRDATEKQKREDRLLKTIIQKEMLINEVHHRVKNNLQIVSSLLKMQSKYIKDEESKTYFIESQNRIASMSLVHEKLFNNKVETGIHLRKYVEHLLAHLSDSYDNISKRVSFNVEVDEIPIDMNYTVPVGLILNETITNAFKHAFPGEREGIINVNIFKVVNNVIIKVKDNGIGLPSGINLRELESLGMKLIFLLAEDQLEGMVSVAGDNGTEFTISFPVEKYIKLSA